MKKILVVISYYLPGRKGGGQVRGLASLIETLGDEFQFYVLTSDRDLGDHQPYPGMKRGVWQTVGKAKVLYLSPQEMALVAWRRLLKTLDYDLLYLIGFFSPLSIKTMFLRRIGWIPEKQIVLFPQGEFSPGALSLKGVKKRADMFLAKWAGLYKDIVWQASCEYEMQDILSIFGGDIKRGNASVWVAPNLPPRLSSRVISGQRPVKQIDSARIVFLSRITRKKNLDTALRFLTHIDGKVQFDIYGPLEDEAYWQECQTLISRLPPNVQVRYRGVVDPDQVAGVFSQYHLFLFPTLGENFGYVILEALEAGCLILTSDLTPWQDLAKKRVGWDLPLSEPEQFRAALNELISMDNPSFEQWSRSAIEYAKEFAEDPASVQANRDLFVKVW